MEKTTTPGGNTRAPSMNIYLNWIFEGGRAYPTNVLQNHSKSVNFSRGYINCFKACGIKNAVDGSEDDKMHCFKANGVIPTGRILL